MVQIPGPATTRATVQSFSVANRHYELRFNDCGKANCNRCGGVGPRKPSHGPYWYLCVISRGKWRRIYLGKELDTTKYINSDGSIAWIEVKTKRRRKDYQEAVNHEVPGQLDMLEGPHDAAGDHAEDPHPHGSFATESQATATRAADQAYASHAPFNPADRPQSAALDQLARERIHAKLQRLKETSP